MRIIFDLDEERPAIMELDCGFGLKLEHWRGGEWRVWLVTVAAVNAGRVIVHITVKRDSCNRTVFNGVFSLSFTLHSQKEIVIKEGEKKNELINLRKHFFNHK